MLTFIKDLGSGYCLWQCDCGNTKTARKDHVKSGRIISCGCKHETRNGLYKHPLYHTWHNMVVRCHSPNATGYANYGAKGITVCAAWRDNLQQFIQDMGPRPANHSLDRIDNNLGYSPENCRWADAPTQGHNKGIMNTNTSGVKGVSWNKRRGMWRAFFELNGDRLLDNHYTTLESAIAARHKYEQMYTK